MSLSSVADTHLSIQSGAGESGKSTVLKQMKLIYANGFSNSEKLEWKPVVFNNVVQSFQMIFEAMNELDIVFENPENEASRSLPAHRRHKPRAPLLLPYRNAHQPGRRLELAAGRRRPIALGNGVGSANSP